MQLYPGNLMKNEKVFFKGDFTRKMTYCILFSQQCGAKLKFPNSYSIMIGINCYIYR